MLVARGRLENRQAIIEIGFQRFVPQTVAVVPDQMPVQVPVQGYRALIDTGAQRTCLSKKVISHERLSRHGKRLIQNVHNEALHSLFWASIGIFANGTTDSRYETRTFFGFDRPTEVIDIADNNSFDAILGMDVLQRCDFRLERSGDFEITLG